ncbi:uncharacterized protein [Cicer arietinum]|uniref:uncharacterized protein n=1 Tax=Cicer arietinum TaxID=3827 RepID=UPI003CC530AB
MQLKRLHGKWIRPQAAVEPAQSQPQPQPQPQPVTASATPDFDVDAIQAHLGIKLSFEDIADIGRQAAETPNPDPLDNPETHDRVAPLLAASNRLRLSRSSIVKTQKMKEIMGIIDILCQTLPQHSQDIVNFMCLVGTTKSLIQASREDGWDALFTEVKTFCEKHDIEILDLNDFHSTTRFGRSHLQQGQITIEHYFRVEIFFTAIDQQLQELNNRFSEQAMSLLNLSCALTPKDNHKTFNIEKISTLVEKYYPVNFNLQEKINLKFQLQHFLVDAHQDLNLKNLSTIQELCSCLVATEKTQNFYLIDRLLHLIITLPVSTITIERSFTTMKIIKYGLRNKMEVDFLADNMEVYIEREIAANISFVSIIDDFKLIKERRALL